MQGMTLFTQNEICIKILSIATNSLDKPNFPHDKAAQEYFSTVKFPIFPVSEIKIIGSELESGISLRTVLLSHSFTFPFYPNHLDTILANIDKSKIKFISMYVLFTYLAWHIAYDDLENIDNTSAQLLVSLAVISKVAPFGNIPINRFIAISAFTSFFISTLTNKKIDDVEEITSILSPLYLFFENQTSIPDQCYDMIHISAKWIISKNNSALSTKINQFFTFASRLNLPESCAEEMLKLTFDSLYDINYNYFLYFPIFFSQVSSNHSSRYLQKAPSSLYEFMKKRPELNIIKFNVKENDNFIKLPETNSIEVSLRFQIFDSFPNGFEVSQVADFPPSVKIHQLVDQLVVQRLTVFVNAAVITEKHIQTMVFNFLEIIQENLNQNLNKKINEKSNEGMNKNLKTNDNEIPEKDGNGSNYIYDLYATFFYMYKLFPPDMISDLPVDLFINFETIFNPHVTVFHTNSNPGICENFDRVNSFRYYVLETLLSNNKESIEKIFNQLVKYPLLFTETLHRFILNHQLIPVKQEILVIFGRTLISAALYYQSIHSKRIKEVEFARAGIYFFLSHIFLDHSILFTLFGDYTFTYSFLSFMFEPPIRPYVLSQLLVYLTEVNKKNSNNNNHNVLNYDTSQKNKGNFDQESGNSNLDTSVTDFKLPQIIFGIIDIACTSFPDEVSLELVSDFLNTLNDAIMHRRQLTSYFVPLVDTVFRGMLALNDSDASKKVMASSLQFLALISNIKILKNVDRNAIENAIHRVYGDNPSQQIFDRLIQLIAAEYLPSLNPSFHIRQPKVVLTFLNLFKKSPRLSDVMNFIKGLCDFSTYNSIACNHSEIDIWLIDYVKIALVDNSNSNYIKDALSLFASIESVVSSVNAVQRYISLLCPIFGRYLSKYHMDILDTLNKIVIMKKRIPSVSVPMQSNHYLNVSGIPSNLVEPSFTFVCWIYHDTTIAQYKPRIFSLAENPEKMIDISFINDQLYVVHQTDIYNTVARIDIRMPPKQWTLIIINYYNISEERGSIVRCKINMGKWEKISLPYMKWKNKFNLSLSIGGTTDEFSPEFPSRFASFGLFSEIDEEVISMLNEAGPTFSPTLPKQCLFYFKPIVVNTEYEYRDCLHSNDYSKNWNNNNLHNNNYFKVIPMKSNIPNNYSIKPLSMSFTDILINISKIDILLPLFTQITMTTENGDNIPHFIDNVLALFSNLFSTADYGQKSFTEFNIFGMISHLLFQLPPSMLTYSIYLGFFGLLESITDGTLQKQLIDDVLMNWELLISIDAENHLRVIRHWVRVLYPSFPSQVEAVRPLKHIFVALRTFYYYQPIEANRREHPTSIKRVYNLNISECRSAILSMCSSMAFDNETFLSFIGHLITLADIQQVRDLLNFLYQQIHKNLALFSSCSDALDATTLLLYIFNFTDIDLCCLVLKIILELHRNRMIKSCTLSEHINVILHQFTGIVIKKPLFDALISLMNDELFYELLPIVCWMALNFPHEEITEFIKKLKPSVHYCFDQSWSYWPLLLSFQTESRDLMKFVLLCENKSWTTLYSMITLIGETTNGNSIEMRATFIHLAASLLLNDQMNNCFKDFQSFFAIAQHFLFLRDEKDSNISPALDYLLKNSPYLISRGRNRASSLVRVNRRLFSRPSSINFHDGIPFGDTTNKRMSIFGDLSDSEQSQQASNSILSLSNNPDVSNSINNSNLATNTQQSNNKKHIHLSICQKTPLKNSLINLKGKLRGPKKVQLIARQITENVQRQTEYLMPSQLTGRIREFGNDQGKKQRFSLRLSEDGNWIDENIAELCLKTYLRWNLKQFLQFDLIICSFLLRSPKGGRRDFVYDHLANLQLTQQEIQENLKLLQYVSVKANHEKLPPYFPLSFESTAIIKELQKILSKWVSTNNIDLIAQQIMTRTIQSCRLKSEKLISKIDDRNLTSSASLSDCLMERLETKRKSNSKLWLRTYRCMIVDRAPWAFSKIEESEIGTVRRDNILCSNFVPQKTRGRDEVDQIGLNLMSSLSTSRVFDSLVSPKNSKKKRNKKKADNESVLYETNCIIISIAYTINSLFSMYEQFCRIRRCDGSSKDIKFDAITHVMPRSNNLNSLHTVKNTNGDIDKINISENNSSSGSYSSSFSNSSSSKIIEKSDNENENDDLVNGIEIFSINGKTLLLNFPNNDCSSILEIFRKQAPHAFIFSIFSHNEIRTQFTEKWINREISNFEYILQLNFLSGRSFNDIEQYPIFPILILDNPEEIKNGHFRDLKKKYGSLCEEDVASYLWLIEPFASRGNDFANIGNSTSNLISKNNSFGTISMNNSILTNLNINQCLNQIPNDDNSKLIKSVSEVPQNSELIPEFFFMPECFKEMELPKWANNSIFDFVYSMRKILESDKVSRNLNYWIDLTFGVNSGGNSEIESSIPKLCQTPHKLFNKRHLRRKEPIKYSIDDNDRAIFIQTQSKNILYSFIEYNNSNNCSNSSNNLNAFGNIFTVVYITFDGKIVTNSFNFEKIEKTVKIPFPLPNRALTPQIPVGGCSTSSQYLSAARIPSTINAPNIISNNDSQSQQNTNSIDNDQIQKVPNFPIPPSMNNCNMNGINKLKNNANNNPKILNSNSPEYTNNNNNNNNANNKVNYNINSKTVLSSQKMSRQLSATFKNSFLSSNSNEKNTASKSIQILSHPKSIIINNFNEFAFGSQTCLSNNFTIIQKNIAFVDGHKNYATLISPTTGEKTNVMYHSSTLLCISASGSCVATANKDSTINLYNSNDLNTVVTTIPLYRDLITCCQVSESFRLIASGTRDGFLILSSITRGTTVSVIDLNGRRPVALTVTKKWGFIVVYITEISNGKVSHSISVYNVNGLHIRTKILPQAITAWSEWSSDDDFDYMLIACENGRMFFFETFYLDFIEIPYRAQSTVTSLRYSHEENGVVAISTNGSILFAPFSHLVK